MNILDKIIVDKRREVILKKSIIPVSQLEASVFSQRLYHENLKIVPLELLLTSSFSIKGRDKL
jgi:hypothetical protein